jgi:hypothetical protein
MTVSTHCCLYIERVKRDVFPPAVSEAQLSTSEHLPIFDEHQAREAERAAKAHAPCYLDTARTESETVYIRRVFVLDITAETHPCFFCGALADAKREKKYFECPRCHALMLFEPAPRYVITPPTKARVSIGRHTDALFALDYLNHEAFLLESFPAEFTRSEPYLGASSELLGIFYGEPVKTSELNGKQLRVMQTGDTFTIIAHKLVVDLLETKR